MLKLKKTISVALAAIMVLSTSCINVFAQGKTMDGDLEVADDVKYYAEIDGVSRECTKEEAEALKQESDRLEEEYLAARNSVSSGIQNTETSFNIMPMRTMVQLVGWGFSNLNIWKLSSIFFVHLYCS